MENFLTNPWTIAVGGTVLAAAIIGVWRFFFKKENTVISTTSQNQNVVVNNFTSPSTTLDSLKKDEEVTHNTTNVLFIDDDTRFKIVNILRKKSWIKCQVVKDIDDFDNLSLVEADVIFVDIEGVGRILTPQEQGLGMVVEINRRYPHKKLIIYSSQPVRDMTHPAFRVVEGVIHKDAQPSEFLRYIEDARNK